MREQRLVWLGCLLGGVIFIGDKKMSYFKVQVMFTQVFEQVVKADDIEHAKKRVLVGDMWMEEDAISQETSVYAVYELEEKQNG